MSQIPGFGVPEACYQQTLWMYHSPQLLCGGAGDSEGLWLMNWKVSMQRRLTLSSENVYDASCETYKANKWVRRGSMNVGHRGKRLSEQNGDTFLAMWCARCTHEVYCSDQRFSNKLSKLRQNVFVLAQLVTSSFAGPIFLQRFTAS